MYRYTIVDVVVLFFFFFFFFFKQKTAYEIRLSLVGSEMCIRDRILTGAVTGAIVFSLAFLPLHTMVMMPIMESELSSTESLLNLSLIHI